MEDDNEKYSKSLDKLEDYTKRFIPTKCLNEFKDCKTNRYYWLDHEGNLEGALELLNLMDCENEKLKQFKDKVFKVIDEKIIECEKAVEEIRLGEKDSYIVKHDVASKILKELKKELGE